MDQQTIERARQGDRTARDTLLRELQDPWFRMCLSLLGGDQDLARDATQETALRFLSRLSSFRGDSSLLTWSTGIAINVSRELRRTRRFDSLDDDKGLTAARGDAGSASVRAEGAEMRSIVQNLLRDLPERQREAIVLRFFEDLSVGETAAAMNCAAGTIKATIHQALRKLRTKMDQVT